ncbi:MAG: hypothetical protein ACTSVL_05010 [Promethearchaeota archaeon]
MVLIEIFGLFHNIVMEIMRIQTIMEKKVIHSKNVLNQNSGRAFPGSNDVCRNKNYVNMATTIIPNASNKLGMIF